MLKNIFIILVLFIFIFWNNLVFCQDSTIVRTYEVQYGTNPNIEYGSQSTIGVSSLIFDQTNQLIKKNIKNKTTNILARIANFGIVQFYFGVQLYAALPHEYFGHYLRAKEYGVTPKMQIDFPAIGGDNVFYVKQSMPVLHRQMIVAAGPELTANIAYKATQQLYTDDYSPHYIGNFLLAGKLVDNIMYVQNNVKPFLDNPNKFYKDHEEYFQRNPVPNDPLSYALALTESYGYYDGFLDKDAIWLQQFSEMGVYTKNDFIHDQYKRMKSAYLQTALDPTNLYFLYANALYLFKGKTFFNPFMLRIKNLSFMPSVRANMGENGIENYYDIFFKPKYFFPFSLYYRTGGNMFHNTRGTGAEIRKVRFSERVMANAQLDYWHNERNSSNNMNVSCGLHLLDRKKSLSVSGHIGYKSAGNLMGKPMGEGLYGALGLSLNLSYKQ